MKDKVARENIQRIADEVGLNIHQLKWASKATNFLHRANALLDKFECISIKDCPKCKHPVLAKGYCEIYQCLTCGVKFRCTEKCVCEVIDV